MISHNLMLFAGAEMQDFLFDVPVERKVLTNF